jgi:hypothetical protein
MSHSHRDDLELVGSAPAEAEPVEVAPPAPVVTNEEAERRAQEKRKLEGIGEQITQHEFSGDLPDPGSGTDVETRVVAGIANEEHDDVAHGSKASSARRGPPPPRFAEPGAATSWAASRIHDAVTPRLPTTSWSTESG